LTNGAFIVEQNALIDKHNALIDRHNDLLDGHNKLVGIINRKVRRRGRWWARAQKPANCEACRVDQR
jgi:hypothetical protein